MVQIKVDNFTKKYNQFKAVDNISFSIEQASITGFVGKNGAGKSTTIRTMLNLLFPTEGTITIQGLDSVKNVDELKEKISYIPSDVAFYDKIKAKDIFKLVSNCGASYLNRALKLAEYFELDTSKKISELSFGNRKKVSIIQGFMRESSIYIFDEPTNGLDPLMQEKFFKLVLEKKNAGATIFLSSHNLSEIEKYCDRAIIIKDGKIVEDINVTEERKNLGVLVSYETSKGKQSYIYKSDINNLISDLSKQNLHSLEIRPVSIEESFMKYYEGGNDEN